jgi:hypothetical protein
MDRDELIASHKRRDKFYQILYDKALETTENDDSFLTAEIVEASCLFLVNLTKVMQKKQPYVHVKVLDYLIRLFDNVDLKLKDEEKLN